MAVSALELSCSSTSGFSSCRFLLAIAVLAQLSSANNAGYAGRSGGLVLNSGGHVIAGRRHHRAPQSPPDLEEAQLSEMSETNSDSGDARTEVVAQSPTGGDGDQESFSLNGMARPDSVDSSDLNGGGDGLQDTAPGAGGKFYATSNRLSDEISKLVGDVGVKIKDPLKASTLAAVQGSDAYMGQVKSLRKTLHTFESGVENFRAHTYQQHTRNTKHIRDVVGSGLENVESAE